MAGTRTYRRQNMVQYTPTAYEQYAAAPMLLQQRADNTRAAIAQEQQALAEKTFGLETEARNAKLQEYQDRIQGVIDAYGGDVARASRDIVPLIGQARNDPAWQHMERLEKERENFRLMQAEAASRGQIALNTGNYKQTIGEDGQLRSNFYNPETGEFNYDVSIQPDIFKVNYRGDQEERVNNIANSYITSTYEGTIDDLNSKIANSIATGRAHNEFGYLMSMEGFLPDEKRMAQEVQGYISSGIGQRHLQKLLLHDYANIPDKEEATRLAVTQMATEMIDAVKERENVQVKESSLRAYNPAAPTGGSGGSNTFGVPGTTRTRNLALQNNEILGIDELDGLFTKTEEGGINTKLATFTEKNNISSGLANALKTFTNEMLTLGSESDETDTSILDRIGESFKEGWNEKTATEKAISKYVGGYLDFKKKFYPNGRPEGVDEFDIFNNEYKTYYNSLASISSFSITPSSEYSNDLEEMELRSGDYRTAGYTLYDISSDNNNSVVYPKEYTQKEKNEILNSKGVDDTKSQYGSVVQTASGLKRYINTYNSDGEFTGSFLVSLDKNTEQSLQLTNALVERRLGVSDASDIIEEEELSQSEINNLELPTDDNYYFSKLNIKNRNTTNIPALQTNGVYLIEGISKQGDVFYYLTDGKNKTLTSLDQLVNLSFSKSEKIKVGIDPNKTANPSFNQQYLGDQFVN